MKTISTLIATMLLLAIAGCSSTHTPQQTQGTYAETELPADERKAYAEALELLKSDQSDKSIAALIKITAQHPNFLAGWMNLTSAYIKNAKYKEAEQALEQAKRLTPPIAELYNIDGLLDVKKGQYKKAEEHYLQALALKSNLASAHYNIALLYDIYFQDIEKALKHYERYLELNPEDKITKNWIAELKQKLSRSKK